ncbi:ras-responsive element-binding protein 1 isoform 3 [Camelus ferus]|nr:ras-responsive element-binding protein 1 isoform 3 [Camelus ferus]
MTSSSPVGLEGSDLSSINTMMSAVMNVGKVAENGGSPQSIKSPAKPPGPNRIGRRNQHNTDTGGADHSCSICGKSLSSASSLDRHMLVHSGERPYKCTVCGQSFTTNGNMHRWVCGSSWDQWSQEPTGGASGAHTEPTAVHPGHPPASLFCLVYNLPGALFPVPVSCDMDLCPDFQSLPSAVGLDSVVPAARVLQASVCVSSGHMKIHEKDPSSTTAAAPPSPLKRRRLSSKRKLSHDAEAEKEDPAPAKKMVEDGQSGDGENKADEVFHCPLCFKEFVCKYGLETHMETHSDNPLRCDICCVTFRTHRGLLRHNALVHKQLPRDAVGRPFIQNNPSIPAGFHDLGFTDFSCRKFPRISQAAPSPTVTFEENSPYLCGITTLGHLSASLLRFPEARCISEQHRYVCDTCDKAFPMLSSLALHKQTHGAADQGRERLQARALPGDALDQKVFLALLGLQHTADARPAPAEEPLPDDNQAIQLQTLKSASLGGSLTVLPATKESMKHLSLQPFQKGFLIQPDSSIVISLPPLSKAPAAPLQAIFKHMPPLKPKPLVTPRTVVATSTPPPLVNAQQASPGCISPSLPPPPLKLLKGSVEAASNAHLLQSKSGAAPNAAAPLFLQQPRAELPGQAEMKTQLEQDSIIEALLPLSMEAKVKQEITEGDLKAIMTGPGGKKTPAMRKVLYPCRFCNQVFAFSGVLRAHVRSHLGISPYQCNICDYIAADKAALIRHLRTHSGERPYICKICHYPFTVKANCERHLRKKHLKATRKDIEKNIEYVTSSAAEMVDAFCSPDTVCRLCGEDLKHYRALRIHMRAHCGRGLGGCPKARKPFECKECNAAFSAKRNCIHHVLKQHLHVPERDIESYAPGRAEEGGDALGERKPLATFLESQNGFLHGGPTQPLPHHVAVKVEPASNFTVDFNEPLDFSQKGLALVQVKQENVASFLSPSASAPYDCSLEPIDLSIPKNFRRGDQDAAAPGLAKKPEQEPGSSEQTSPCPPACPTQPVTVGPSGVLEKSEAPAAASAASTLEAPAPSLQGSVQLAVPIYSSALVNSSPVLGNSTLISSPALLRPLRPKPPLLLPKPPMTEELPPLASIAQIISSVSSAPTLLKTKVADPGPANTGSNTTASDSVGATIPKATTDTTSPKESSDPPPAANSPEAASPTEQGPAGLSKKRGRKRGTRSRLRGSGGVDLDSSGEFASIEKMLANAGHHGHQQVHDEEQGSPPEDKLLRAKRNSYANCLQKISCPHCPRVFPWASSLQRHMLTHTGQKPFPCQKCGAFFSTKSNCERHQLRKHGVPACSLRRNGLIPQSKESDVGAQDSTEKRSEEAEGPSDGDGEGPAEKKSPEKSDDDKKPKTDSPRSAASKADKRKKVCSVCSKRFWSLQDLTRHMRSHTGERPYKCQTCERTFTLKHSLVRHQRVHQKARRAEQPGKDSDREERGEEDSGSESTHSGNNPPSESEADSALLASNRMSVTRSRKESLAAKDASRREERAAGRTAGAGHSEAGRSAPRAAPMGSSKEQASQGDPDRESPAALGQDLPELPSKRPAPSILATADSASLLGME